MIYKTELSTIKSSPFPLDAEICIKAFNEARAQYDKNSYGGNHPQITEIIFHKNSVEIFFTTQKQLREPVRALKDYLAILVDLEPFDKLKVGSSRRVFTQKPEPRIVNKLEVELDVIDDSALLGDVARVLFDPKYASKRVQFRTALYSLLDEIASK